VTAESSFDYLSVEDLIEIAAAVVGPTLAIRDIGLLASAAARPRTAVFGEEPYPDLAAKAAALMHALARNHPLVDGNKRLAWSATRIFCLMNGRDVEYGVDDAEALVVAVAAGEVDIPPLARSIREHLATPRW
jgi:death-on-curing protein